MIPIPAELEPIAAFIRSVMGTIQWFLGGLFGLYVILIILRIFEFKKVKKRLEIIEKKLDKLMRKRK